VESPGDRGYYSAPALSPDGTDLYLMYNAFTTPFRDDTTSVCGLVGVVLHADVGPAGAPTGWTEVHRGAVGDPRGSAQNNIIIEFLGDYVYVVSDEQLRGSGLAGCPERRCLSRSPDMASGHADGPGLVPEGRPAIQEECPATFGNTDIFAWSGADPTA